MADISTTNLDAGTDSPAAARVELLAAVQRLNAVTRDTPSLGDGAAMVRLRDPGNRWASSNIEDLAEEIYGAIRAPGITIEPGTVATNHTSITAAINALNAAGGGVLQLSPGSWPMQGLVSASISTGIMVRMLPGAIISRATAGGVFEITLAGGSARFVLDGHGIISADFTGGHTSSAVKITGDSSPRGLVVSGDIWIRAGTGSWRYAIDCNSVQDADLSGLLVSGDGEPGNNMSALHITATAGASVSWSLRGLDVYNCLYGIHCENTAAPGIEGLKLLDCDFVSVKHGLLYTNTSGYVPPQIELIGTHINAWNSCLKIEKLIQVSIIGGLFYRYSRSGGTYHEGAFAEFDGVQDLHVSGLKMSSVAMPARGAPDVIGLSATGGAQTPAFLRFGGLHYWSSAGSQPVIKLAGSVYKATIGGDCTKSTASGRWVDTSAMTSGLENVRLSPELDLVAADYPATVMTDCAFAAGAVNVAPALWGNVNVTGAASGNTIASLTGWTPGRTYLIKCDTAGVILQHNAGCNLRGTANLTFAAGDTVTLYGEAGTLREIARRGA